MTDTTSTPIYAPVRSDIKRGDIKVRLLARGVAEVIDLVTGQRIGKAVRGSSKRGSWTLFAGEPVLETRTLGKPWLRARYDSTLSTLSAIPAQIAYWGYCQRAAIAAN